MGSNRKTPFPGTFAEQYARRMKTRKNLKQSWETRRANESKRQRNEDLSLVESPTQCEKGDGDLHCDGERGQDQGCQVNSHHQSFEDFQGQETLGESGFTVAAFWITYLSAILIACLAIGAALLLSGCAIEMIAVVRTEDAVNGKLSIHKEQTYDATTNDPSLLDRILPAPTQ